MGDWIILFEFQFHSGAIQTCRWDCLTDEVLDFNSTLVRFKLVIAGGGSQAVQAFQFHSGAIQTDSPQFAPAGAFGFQFHSGAIQTLRSGITPTLAAQISIPLWCDSNSHQQGRSAAQSQHFNSTLVRFKLNGGISKQHSGPQFQFHSGAIQTVPFKCTEDRPGYFNSTLVRFKRTDNIKDTDPTGYFNSTLVRFKQDSLEERDNLWAISIPLWCDSNYSVRRKCRNRNQHFNSTLVRFKLFRAWTIAFCSNQFQFHSGAIQTQTMSLVTERGLIFQFHSGAIQTSGERLTAFADIVFQFHSGAIQTLSTKELILVYILISIPLWCDSNYKHTFPNVCACSISIPLWCDSNWTLCLTHACELLISIPLWCDSNLPRLLWEHFLCQISIPLWCDSNSHIGSSHSLYPIISIPLWCDSNPQRTDSIQLRGQHFNSTLVRFKLVPLRGSKCREWYFNSTLVRFKLIDADNFSIPFTDFNSTLVRFKRCAEGSKTWGCYPFQFHSGAIQTLDWLTEVFGGNKFQFHSGAIQTFLSDLKTLPGYKFQFHSGAIQTVPLIVLTRFSSWFQFHSGAIQTEDSLLDRRYETEFQFHSGAIQTGSGAARRWYRCLISIPLWCDSNSYRAATSRSTNKFQFHSGAIQTAKQLGFSGGEPNFNSTLVRFKPYSCRIARSEVSISIPLWCDSNNSPSLSRRTFYSYFNSTLVRFKLVPATWEDRLHSISIPLWCDSNPVFLLSCK